MKNRNQAMLPNFILTIMLILHLSKLLVMFMSSQLRLLKLTVHEIIKALHIIMHLPIIAAIVPKTLT